MKLRLILLLLIALFHKELCAQVTFDSRDPNLFKVYGSPLESVYTSIEDALRAKSAKKLDLRNVGISPKTWSRIAKLKELEIVFFQNNGMNMLPPGLANAQNLIILISNNNSLKQFPESYNGLSNLMYIEFQKTAFQSFPYSLHKLERLELFRIFENDADSVVFSDTMPGLPALRSIQFYGVALNQIPSFLSRCKQLEEISLVNCNISEIPDFIDSLPRLKKLNLSGNQIREIPRTLFKCLKLQEVDLSNNQLTEAPEELAYMRPLGFLNLKGNMIPYEELDILRILMPFRITFHSDIEKLRPKK
jgi:internalin A